jgi:putative heme degradation protein
VSTIAGGTTTAYVVRDAEGEVVVAFWGASAPEEVERWRERNFQVEQVKLTVG